mmetsp:Transcript_137205/g.382714  ORF Transcript_137205/g.382714 Transcript_137205/m.382714 type:complete len:380 (-) Transcript_137205:74-1213(-)|eukprot:CAMPEP_0179100224 /NCGR_PEP_ID=MMETSP0796-20121207/46274_1 /TAXON_ID=73915 /ORGANISM="Pyrodinium bahamense, Strain pbaha01" /LENGTH=379 /DNA_ID=CAMNT_0020798037 /DNA_START=72 /DNA_END=1211 /DNA_ORIENTATION=+
MNYPSMMPGGLSADSYADRCLRPFDAECYSAAGLLLYRRAEQGIELLLPRERPWNSFIQAYDPVALNVFGGKRVPRQDHSVQTTAVRCFVESLGQVGGAPDQAELYALLHSGFAVWYAMGRFALLVMEVPEENMRDLPDKFMAAKQQQGPAEEFKMLPSGIKKWQKQIEDLEWVTSSKLLVAPQSEVTDLLSNILQIKGFREFLEGSLDPAMAWPQTGNGLVESWMECGKADGKGKGFKGKGGGGKAKGGYGRDSKGFKGCGKSSVFGGGKGMGIDPGKGMGVYPGKGMVLEPPMVYSLYDQHSAAMQRQMYGEQLYLMVQQETASPSLAQKITGMLLELPQNELLMTLTNQEELRKRVQEALEVLKEDGVPGSVPELV